MKVSRIIIILLFLIIGFYASIFIFDVENKALFMPSKFINPVIEGYKNKLEEGSFKAKNGNIIHFWHIKGDEKKPTILYSHGNAFNMTNFQTKLKFLADKNFNIFLYDYEGYGKSTGKPSEQALYNDIDEMINYLDKKYKIKRNNLILWGHSMGGGVVTNEAALKSYKGVILEDTFTSIPDVKNYAVEFKSKNFFDKCFKAVLYNSIPVSQKFENIKKIDKISSPLLIIHSKEDEMIPYWMGKKLSETNLNAKFYTSEKGRHNQFGWQNNAVLNFIGKL